MLIEEEEIGEFVPRYIEVYWCIWKAACECAIKSFSFRKKNTNGDIMAKLVPGLCLSPRRYDNISAYPLPHKYILTHIRPPHKYILTHIRPGSSK